MDPEVEVGKIWVEAELHALLKKGLPTEGFEWEVDSEGQGDELAPEIFHLAIWSGENRQVLSFSKHELMDVKGSPQLQAALGRRLEESLGRRR